MGTPAVLEHVIHEKRSHPSSGILLKRDRVDGDLALPMRIGMTQSNLDAGHDMLLDVSNPDSSNYGRHYTAAEVRDIFAPSQDTVDTVVSWLVERGIDQERISQSTNKQWLQFDARTSEVENLLATEYHYVENSRSGEIGIATDKYHVPRDISGHIDYITPGISPINLSVKGTVVKRSPSSRLSNTKPSMVPMESLVMNPLAHCDTVITPPCIRALYNITLPTKAVEGNDLGIYESADDHYSQEDLDNFYTTFAPNIANGTGPTFKSVDGGNGPVDPVDAGIGSDLNLQLLFPLLHPQGITLYQVDDTVYEEAVGNGIAPNGFLNTFLDALDGSYCTLSAFGETGNSAGDPQYPDPAPGGYKGQLQCGVYKPNNVIVITYNDGEDMLPLNYQRRQCLEFMKLGLQGTTVVVSSGVHGVGGFSGETCAGPDGKIFEPTDPTTCPYILTVGSTFLPPGANVTTDSEIATVKHDSGGGFSNIYPQPDYQKDAVQTYLTEHTPSYPAYSSIYNSSFGANGGIYNKAGRGIPDVSAVGENLAIIHRGNMTTIGGTAVSAPIWASIITRINAERLSIGKSTVGFINPTLVRTSDKVRTDEPIRKGSLVQHTPNGSPP
ncbi:Tripeptidyl-peptidase sed1 [Trichoderma velutinum]